MQGAARSFFHTVLSPSWLCCLSVSMLEQWQCSRHGLRTMRRRIYVVHLAVYRGIIEQPEQVEIDTLPTALNFVTKAFRSRKFFAHRPSTFPSPYNSLRQTI
jgi:hypothetical protein